MSAGAVAGSDAPLLRSLSGLRLIAALAVVYAHSANAFVSVPALRAVAAVAYPAVDLFFLLSGFVITWVWKPELTARAFWRRRAARILPVHVVTWAVAVPILWIELDRLHVVPSLAALLFLNAWVPDHSWYHAANGVAWSLAGELVFYATFPFIRPVLDRLAVRRLLQIAAGGVGLVMLLAGLTVLFIPADLQVGLLYINPLPRAVECWSGACLAVAISRGWRLRLPVAISSTLIVTSLAALAALTFRWDTDLPAPAMAFSNQVLPAGVSRPLGIVILLPMWVVLLASLAGRDVDGRGVRWLSWAPLVTASTWTYSLYMTHGPFVKLANGVLKHVPFTRTPVTGVLIEVLFVAASLLLAWAVYRWFERPMERRFRTSGGPADVPRQRAPQREATRALSQR